MGLLRNSRWAILVSAVIAVMFWSLKPVFVSLMGTDVGFVEVYLLSVGISLIGSLVISAFWHRSTVAIISGGRKTWNGVKYASLSGLFLAMWYYGFYRALFESSKTEATVVAFVWPLIAVIAMRLFSPKTAPPLKLSQWGFVIMAFIGAGIVVGGSALSNPTFDFGLVWAVIAAIGSGLYLPFTLKALDCFEGMVKGDTPKATFYAITVANFVAFGSVLLAMIVSSHSFDFSQISLKILGLCTLIGLGTYLFAEIAWSWAFKEYASLTLSALPYFSPAVSVTLLAIFFHEKLTLWTVIGMIAILASNLLLAWSKARKPAKNLDLEKTFI